MSRRKVPKKLNCEDKAPPWESKCSWRRESTAISSSLICTPNSMFVLARFVKLVILTYKLDHYRLVVLESETLILVTLLKWSWESDPFNKECVLEERNEGSQHKGHKKMNVEGIPRTSQLSKKTNGKSFNLHLRKLRVRPSPKEPRDSHGLFFFLTFLSLSSLVKLKCGSVFCGYPLQISKVKLRKTAGFSTLSGKRSHTKKSRIYGNEETFLWLTLFEFQGL